VDPSQSMVNYVINQQTHGPCYCPYKLLIGVYGEGVVQTNLLADHMELAFLKTKSVTGFLTAMTSPMRIPISVEV
jgi:hypothetical protein